MNRARPIFIPVILGTTRKGRMSSHAARFIHGEVGKRDGVQVNTVNPGSVDTDRFRHRLAIIKQKTGLDETAALEHHRRELDITRFGKPVAEVVPSTSVMDRKAWFDSMKGTFEILGDIVSPANDEDEWEVLRD